MTRDFSLRFEMTPAGVVKFSDDKRFLATLRNDTVGGEMTPWVIK